MKNSWREKIKDQQQARKKLSELNGKIEKLEERYVQGEVEPILFQKFSLKYQNEKKELEKLLSFSEISGSNLEKLVEKRMELTGNLSKTWALSGFDGKRKLQTLVFPEGILYNKQKDLVRTPRIHSLFAPIPSLSAALKGNKKGHLLENGLNAHWVAPPRIELGSKV